MRRITVENFVPYIRSAVNEQVSYGARIVIYMRIHEFQVSLEGGAVEL